MAIKYKWLAGRLREQLSSYAAQNKNRLPTEAQISQRYQVSRQTVRQALAVLEQEGLITRRQGSGSYLTGRTVQGQNTIALLPFDDSDYIYPALLHDMRKIFAQNGFSVQVHPTGNTFAGERACLEELLCTPPRALLIEGVKTAFANPNIDRLRALLKKSCPIVFFGGSYPQLSACPCIARDDFGGACLLTRHLIGLGHTAIGSLFPADLGTGQERYQGMVHTLLENGLFPDDAVTGWYLSDDPAYALQKAAQGMFSSCTAVLCYDDRIAYPLSRSLTIPVFSFDHSYLCSFGTNPFVSLTEPTLGTAAAQTVVDLLKGIPAPSRKLSWSL